MNLLTLFVSFVESLFKPSDRRAIVAQNVSTSRPKRAAVQTIVHQSAVNAVANYQTASSDARRAIVLTSASNGPNVPGQNDTPNREVTAADVDLTLFEAHRLFATEYDRQFAQWCKVNGRPNYLYEVPDLTKQTYQAIGQAATALLKGAR